MLTIFQPTPGRGQSERNFAAISRSWRQQNPDCRYEMVSDDSIAAWLDSSNLAAAIRRHFGHHSARPLYAYLRLFADGGLYVAPDSYCLRPVHRLVGRFPEATVLGSLRVRLPELKHSIPNTWMYAAISGHPFWLLALYLACTVSGSTALPSRPRFLYDSTVIYHRMQSGSQLRAWRNLDEFSAGIGAVIPDRLPAVAVLPPSHLHPLSPVVGVHVELLQELQTADDIAETVSTKVGGLVGGSDSHAVTLWQPGS